MKQLYAWGWTPNKSRLDEWRDMIPGLGVVHYPQTFHLARRGDIAFVNSVSAAEKAALTPEKWFFAILGDERNVTGPSGHYETPEDYMERLAPAKDILDAAGIPSSSAGLAMAGGHFDREYQEALLDFGNYMGQNFRSANFRRAMKGIHSMENTEWFVTEIPMRLNWWPLKYLTLGSWFWQTFITRPKVKKQFELLMKDPQILATTIWCLHEGKLSDGHWQGWHGLIDRNDKLTWQGRLVRDLLRNYNADS